MKSAHFSEHYAHVYDLLHQSKDYAAEIDFVLSLLEKEGLHQGYAADLACGTGKHLVELAKRGWSIFGNDLSVEMIKLTKVRLANEKLDKVKLNAGPMQAVYTENNIRFDLATCFYTALGYLTEDSNLDQFFLNLGRVIRPGGYFFADFWNGTRMAKEFSPSRIKMVEDSNFKVCRKSITEKTTTRNSLNVKFEFQVQFKKTNENIAFAEEHLVRYHTPSEVEKYLIRNGFQLVSTGPFFDESSDLDKAWNFYVLARKLN